MKILVFDIWGDYAHFKKIYATTSALSYLIPTKPTIYGYVGAIIGLQKFGDEYLSYFKDKSCLIGLSLKGSVRIETLFSDSTDQEVPVLMRRLGVNMRAELGARKPSDSPKPTLIEYVYRPKYRLYFYHTDPPIYNEMKACLIDHRCYYTPSLGLAGLISNFQFVGEFESDPLVSNSSVPIHSVIPKKQFLSFDNQMFAEEGQEFSIVEQSMFAIEMDTERNVTERDDILLERKGKPILATVSQYYSINGSNIVLF